MLEDAVLSSFASLPNSTNGFVSLWSVFQLTAIEFGPAYAIRSCFGTVLSLQVRAGVASALAYTYALADVAKARTERALMLKDIMVERGVVVQRPEWMLEGSHPGN